MPHLLQVLLLLAGIIIAAKLAGALSVRYGQPAVFGEIAIGLILGPTFLDVLNLGLFSHIEGEGSGAISSLVGAAQQSGLLERSAHSLFLEGLIKDLAEIGVILLMFVAGMETDLEAMKKVGKVAFWAAMGGVFFPLAGGIWTTTYFGYPLYWEAIFVGTILTATSVSISAQTLMELKVLRSKEGTTILGAAVIDDVLGIIVLVLVFLATIVGIIFVQEGARRIPIVSAKRQVGGAGVLPTRQSYLPLKLNAGGVMPIIFASALIFLPVTIANLTKSEWLIRAASALNPGAANPWPYALTFFALILGFSYFYASLTVNPADIATNLKRGGVAIPGVRPGSATATYLSGVQNRLTLLGGLFLGAVAIIPAAVERATNVQTFQGLGATSLLILVGVAIDTAKQVQTYVISQRYEGLVRQ